MSDATPDPRLPAVRWRHLFGWFTLASTLFLIFVGGLVTSTDSALAVPDWPLSYGMLMPPMVGGIFYEHGHRMVASFVGFLTLVLAFWTARTEPRPAIRRLAWIALAAVCVQGLLGGLRVVLLNRMILAPLHACLAQTFLCLVVALTYTTSREWLTPTDRRDDTAGVRLAAAVATAVVFLQLLAGALVRHAEAGLAIPDFPLAFGRLVPPLEETPVVIHFLHRLGALAVTVAAAQLVWRAIRSQEARLARPAWVILGLVAVQIGLGGATVLTGTAVYPTTAHVATGAAILASCAFITLRAFRLLRPAAQAVVAGDPLPLGTR
jgi:cytochrome c oxidase assembly protein subunit 15